MRPLIGLLVVIVLPSLVQAQASPTDAEVLAKAEAAFQQGVDAKEQFLVARKHFAAAADHYLELHRRGVRSPGLYRSLGNAAVLADRWPEAIWAYQVGLQLDPNDHAMREHLAFARAKVIYPPSREGRLDADSWPAWLHRPTRFELACVFLLAYVLAWVAAACAFLSQRTLLWLLTALALLGAGAAGVGLWHEERLANLDQRAPVVIVAENAPFYRGNAVSYPQHATVPILPRGLEARQIHRRSNWLQIRLSTGEVGWLPRSQALIVEP